MVSIVGIYYVGPAASEPGDIVTRYSLTNALDTAPVNRTDTASQVLDEANLRAAKTYVDNQDALYALPSYYQTQDSTLNVPVTSKGAANGVAGLDATGKVPLAQLPVLGAGYLVGPYGPQHQDASPAVFSGSTGSTPLKICDWEIGISPTDIFRPIVFMNLMVSCSTDGWPIIEARVSDGAAAYSSQTLVARGVGRTSFFDAQSISVLPCPNTTGASGTSTPPTYTNLYVSAWMYDGRSHSVTLGSSGIISAALWLLRTDE